MEAFTSYFKDISQGVNTTFQGLGLTLKHLFRARKGVQTQNIRSDHYFEQSSGVVTLQYPYEAIPVPDNGRYRLHNEIDDCIVCDKCAKICPVNCIDIVAIKSTEEIGLTSDGSSKRLYAATFDIDMAKCCYCGLCTTVCPTECLTMTSTFDYSEFDVREMNYHFTDLSPEEAIEKQRIYDQKQAEKAAAKLQSAPQAVVSSEQVETPKPAFKPKFPVSKPVTESQEITEEKPVEEKPKVVFKPKMPIVKTGEVQQKQAIEEIKSEKYVEEISEEPKPKVVFKPKMPALKIVQPPNATIEEVKGALPEVDTNEVKEDVTEKPKVVFKPKMMVPKIPPKKSDSE